MKFSDKSIILLVLMLVSASLAAALRPTTYLADLRPKVDLAQTIPNQFDDWRELQQTASQIINPQHAVLLKKIYSQTLSRTYVNSNGVVIMLSVAYGANQSDAVALHYPEVCYPAQGFQVTSNVEDILETKFSNIQVKRLTAKLGMRFEPVTYWSTVGNTVVKAGMQTKMAQLRYGIKGQIPDGLIFRVSSINNLSKDAFVIQDAFVRALITALPQQARLLLAGISYQGETKSVHTQPDPTRATP